MMDCGLKANKPFPPGLLLVFVLTTLAEISVKQEPYSKESMTSASVHEDTEGQAESLQHREQVSGHLRLR